MTMGAWNHIAPKAETVVRPALDFVGNMVSKGYNYVTSAFDMGLDDIKFDFGDDDWESEQMFEEV